MRICVHSGHIGDVLITVTLLTFTLYKLLVINNNYVKIYFNEIPRKRTAGTVFEIYFIIPIKLLIMYKLNVKPTK